ncbi:MAG: MarR family transcriptional regulator [Candidatus Eisenbacteria bacterium]|nr:MarR family transcriptional regulator [Candidatus Latescibacterota bacterium]MBD3303258.1 MarR family transcriptional regulator [Candidatus Eisenbacteria bacterium]
MKRDPKTLEHEAFIALQRLAGRLVSETERFLRPWSLSASQLNALRILRGAAPGGLSCREVAERMITRDPDVTRLLDRLEKMRLVKRTRESTDRRVIRTRITGDGLALLERIDRPLAELHLRQLGHLGPDRLRSLLALLDAAGDRGDEDPDPKPENNEALHR